MKNLKLRSHFLYTLLVAVFVSSCSVESKRYKVEITFCDNRPKKVVIINSSHEPSNSDIITYKRAVPEFGNYMNVCEVRVIK